MSEINFKIMLARIKQDFHNKFITLRRSYLTIEEGAQLLYKYMNGDPLTIKKTLLRSTGKNELTWDDLLQFLEQQLSVLQTVKKIQYSPLSSTQIVDRHINEFTKLNTYVKMRQSNIIQSIHELPIEILGEKIVAICFEKQIIFYDCDRNMIINSINFSYTHVRGKIMQKQQQKKINKLLRSQKLNIQMSDQVQQIVNISQNRNQRSINFLTNNIKNSVRGSQLSSQKSNDKMLFRRNTQSIEKKKLKSNFIKIKNDDIKKVFQFFQQSSINNSINIAHAFVNARANFQKSIILQNSFLEKESKQRNFELSSAKFHKNYQKQLIEMKRANKHFSSVRASLSLQSKSRRNQSKYYNRRQSLYQRELLSIKQKNEQIIDPLQMNSKTLEINNICIYQNLLLISLFNRQIRLFRLKRSLNRIVQESLYQKCYKDIIVFVQIYKSQNTELYHIVVGLEKDNQSQVIVYHLDTQFQIKQKVFDQQFSYSAKYQSIMPYGLALFNQLGYFSVIELNSSLDGMEQKLASSTQLFNPETDYRISINQVRINEKLTNIFIGCSSGYVYLYDRFIKSIKYQTRICASPILDMCLFHYDEQLLVVYNTGSMAIISTFHLQKIFIYQSYGEISNQYKIFKGFNNNFFIYSTRTVIPYTLCENQQKTFNNIKSSKILKSRMKLKNLQKKAVQKSKVLRVIEGKGGQQDYLAIIQQKGQIILFNSKLDYVGSYYYFNVLHIVDIFCNKYHQFLAILLDNNSIQIVNLYTQNTLFTVKSIQVQTPPLPRNNLFSESSLQSSSIGMKKRQKQSATSGINIVQFMNEQISNCFLSVITKTGKVNHYNQKGILVTNINLEDRLGQLSLGPMVYEEQQLIIGSDCNILILYRKSYNRKGVIKVSKYSIIKLRKCIGNYNLCVMDREYNIILVNCYNKQIRYIYEGYELNRYEIILLNELYILLINDDRGRLIDIRQDRNRELMIDNQKYLYSMIDENIIQINRNNAKINKYNNKSNIFQDFIY